MSFLGIGGHGDCSAKLFGSHKHCCDSQWPLTGCYFKHWNTCQGLCKFIKSKTFWNPSTSKIELFKTLVNSWKLLTNDTKSSIWDVVGVLDMLLKMYFVIAINIYQRFSLQVNNRYFRVPLHLNCSALVANRYSLSV